MEQDLLSNLPSEIMLDILSRLPMRTITSCKCVCEAWLELLETREFVNSHVSKLAPGITFVKRGEQPKPFEIVEFADDDIDDYRWDTVLNFDLPSHDVLLGVANGFLLCIRAGGVRLVCNPMTRDYIELPSSTAGMGAFRYQASGFGVSRMSGQYKVVRIFEIQDYERECHVYSVGTGSWRRIACGCDFPVIKYLGSNVGAFLNGNIHWLAKEIFTTFSTPPCHFPGKVRTLCVLKDCLCVCDNSDLRYERFADCETNIWLMKEYGDEKSWTKQFVIRKESKHEFDGHLHPIKVFEDGGILMEWTYSSCRTLIYYSTKTRTIRELDMSALEKNALQPLYSPRFLLLKPSFLPLKSFALENVSSF